MRVVLPVIVLAMLSILPAGAQQPADAPPPPAVEDVEADPEEAPPTATDQPLIDESVPVEPPEATAPEPSPAEQLRRSAIEFYQRTQDAPPHVGAWLADNPALATIIYVIRRLSGVIIWLALFLIVGRGGSRLLRPLFGARSADAEESRGYARADRSFEQQGDRRGAAADTVAWLIALVIACEAVGLTWFAAFFSEMMTLLGTVVSTVVWLGLLCALAALIAWSFSERGRRLVLSLIGSLYLKYADSRPPEGHVFRLPDGREGVIEKTDAMHSVMRPVDGGEAILMPNADIMEQYYNWAAPQSETGPTA